MYFPTTQWTLLAQATLSGESVGRQALEDLCHRYWSPLYQFIRARGYNEAEAKDLTLLGSAYRLFEWNLAQLRSELAKLGLHWEKQ